MSRVIQFLKTIKFGTHSEDNEHYLHTLFHWTAFSLNMIGIYSLIEKNVKETFQKVCNEDISTLPTIFFILSVVVYNVKFRQHRIRLPIDVQNKFLHHLVKCFEIWLYWTIINIIIYSWESFYGILSSYFTTVEESYVPAPWLGVRKKVNIIYHKSWPTILGTAVSGFCFIKVILKNDSVGEMDKEKREDNRGLNHSTTDDDNTLPLLTNIT